ncbi:hypothetical protein Btru_066275 [Bulinus truncatus]|nr:hypothetical protein Btru_066275 [Bulinus truncatus]
MQKHYIKPVFLSTKMDQRLMLLLCSLLFCFRGNEGQSMMVFSNSCQLTYKLKDLEHFDVFLNTSGTTEDEWPLDEIYCVGNSRNFCHLNLTEDGCDHHNTSACCYCDRQFCHFYHTTYRENTMFTQLLNYSASTDLINITISLLYNLSNCKDINSSNFSKPNLTLSFCPNGSDVQKGFIKRGSTATCRCQLTDQTIYPVQVQWLNSAGQKVSVSGNYSDLVISGTNGNNESWYICDLIGIKDADSIIYHPKFYDPPQVTNFTVDGRNGFEDNVTSFPDFVDINVTCPIKSVTQDTVIPSVQISPDENTKFTFEVYGYPEPTEYGLKIETGKSTSDVDSNKYRVTYTRMTPPLGLITVTVYDANTKGTITYVLSVKNKAGEVSLKFRVIKETPQQITSCVSCFTSCILHTVHMTWRGRARGV